MRRRFRKQRLHRRRRHVGGVEQVRATTGGARQLRQWFGRGSNTTGAVTTETTTATKPNPTVPSADQHSLVQTTRCR
jgi:hypothetical protein